jgi:uncharacterized protein
MKLSKGFKLGIAVVCAIIPLSLLDFGPHEIPSCQAFDDADTRNSITVSGEGKLFTPSDEAVLSLGVTTIKNSASLAMTENAKTMASVLAALHTKGLSDNEMKTGNVSLWPRQEYSENKEPKIISYTANNQVIIKTKQLDKLGAFIDVSTAAGVTDVSQLTFQLSEDSEATNSALKAALKNARKKAETLAGEVGATLGKAVIINEASGPDEIIPPTLSNMAYNSGEEKALDDTTTIIPQEVRVVARVTIMFEMK